MGWWSLLESAHPARWSTRWSSAHSCQRWTGRETASCCLMPWFAVDCRLTRVWGGKAWVIGWSFVVWAAGGHSNTDSDRVKIGCPAHHKHTRTHTHTHTHTYIYTEHTEERGRPLCLVSTYKFKLAAWATCQTRTQLHAAFASTRACALRGHLTAFGATLALQCFGVPLFRWWQ